MKVVEMRPLLIFLVIFVSACTPPGYVRAKQLLFYEDKRDEIVNTALKYAGAKYKDGGSTPGGFDCSGFTMFVYKENGFKIPRSSRSQYNAGRSITLKFAKPGDLVFFNINNVKISHVGIYLGNYDFIHAPSDGKSVYRTSITSKYWERRYVGAVTYFPDR